MTVSDAQHFQSGVIAPDCATARPAASSASAFLGAGLVLFADDLLICGYRAGLRAARRNAGGGLADEARTGISL
jgi:hypothetical protein